MPGEPYSFSALKRAQALGDLKSLQSNKRCVWRVDLGQDVKAGHDRFSKASKTLSHKAQAAPASWLSA
jgi:hypothetical protein